MNKGHSQISKAEETRVIQRVTGYTSSVSSQAVPGKVPRLTSGLVKLTKLYQAVFMIMIMCKIM